MKKTTLPLTAFILVAGSCQSQAWNNPLVAAKSYVASYFKPSYTDYMVNAYRKTASFVSWLVHRKCEQEKNAQVCLEQERSAQIEQEKAALQNKCKAQEIMLKRNGAYIQEIQKQGDTMLVGVHDMRKTLHECRQDIAAFDNDIKTGFEAINSYFQSKIVTPAQSAE